MMSDINKLFHKAMLEITQLKKQLKDAESVIEFAYLNYSGDITEIIDEYKQKYVTKSTQK